MANNIEDYYFCKEMGICTNCMKREALSGKTRCHECLCSLAISAEKNRAKKSEEQKALENERRRLQMRELREQKKRNGICQWCNKPLSQYSNILCVDCRVKSMQRNKKRNRSLVK